MLKLLKLFVLSTILLWTQYAFCHKASDSYLQLNFSEGTASGQWDIALRDIDFAIGLDEDGNGEINWGEVKAHFNRIDAWAVSSINIEKKDQCLITIIDHLIDHHSDGAYLVLRFSIECPNNEENITISYRLLFNIDAQHRGLLNIKINDLVQSAILSPENNTIEIKTSGNSFVSQFFQYFVEGIWHIWQGYDHVLFLISLLLPAVLIYQSHGQRTGVKSFSVAFKEVLAVVTAFTLAHSITLCLATLMMIEIPPTRLVESFIAATIIFSGTNNLKPFITKKIWLMAFLFGLIHGFGFANVLLELGLNQSTLAISLVGFNLGVEMGQLVIVAIFLPTAYFLRNTQFYKLIIFKVGSLLTILLALVWLIERIFNLKLIS